MAKLTVKQIKSALDGVLFDGEGLYLRVSNGGTHKSWVLRCTFAGKRIDVGLGSAKLLSLADAREEARRLRREARLGNDPRRSKRRAGITFAEAVDTYLKIRLKEFKSEKHRDQWASTLRTYALCRDGEGKPIEGSPRGLGDIGVDMIAPEDVKRVLEPIWATKTETASRLRSRIEKVLSWAKVEKHRTGENPARWNDNLEHMLPKPSKLKRVKHHDALPWQDVPGFMEGLAQRGGMAARCLEFLILTATRSGEAREARWQEFDLDAGVWTIPAARMKMGVEHRVPLTPQALAVVHRVRGIGQDLVFPTLTVRKGAPKGTQEPMSYNAFTALFKRMGVPDITTHGFRSTFRDWASESARASDTVAEMCLAHSVHNAVEKAYARSDLFDRRRELMTEWANYSLPIAA